MLCRSFIILASAAIGLFLFCLACKKMATGEQCPITYECIDPGLHPYFLGYTRMEASSVYCRKYAKSTNFTMLLSAAYFAADSQFQYPDVLFNYYLDPGFDYEFIIATTDTYRIFDIVVGDTSRTITGSCSGMGKSNYVCLNNLDSIYVTRNGAVDTPVHFWAYEPGNGYLIELKK
ncbi:MAG: hypothetical protein JSS82_17335 [Bacteroidetes bacterium]|nr:hypothetical protein [Bacteroidota bacterium]